MSLNQSFNISLGSLKNNQMALSVVSHNIANMNTDGYYRQKVNFSENRIAHNGVGVINQIYSLYGASIDSLSGVVNNGLLNSVVDSNADANYYNGLKDGLEELEGVADDLGENGLNSLLTNFFSAASKLEQYPTDMALRQQYVASLNDVCEKFNIIADKYNSIQDDSVQSATDAVGVVNTLLSNLAEVNVNHIKNGGASETQSQINSILQQLSDYIDVTYDVNDNGSYNVYLGSTAIVKGAGHIYNLEVVNSDDSENPLQFALVNTQDKSEVLTNNVNESVGAGKLKSYLDMVNNNQTRTFRNVQDMKKAVDHAAGAFINALNEIQTYKSADGNTVACSIETVNNELVLKEADSNLKILKGAGASDIKVAQEFFDNPFNVSVARVDKSQYSGDDWKKAIGNSDNAYEIVNLENAKICTYDGSTNNCTLSQFLISNATRNGLDLSNISNKADVYQSIAEADMNNFKNATGVNLDEELADMIRYQRAYEASARVFAVADQMLQTILSMV